MASLLLRCIALLMATPLSRSLLKNPVTGKTIPGTFVSHFLYGFFVPILLRRTREFKYGARVDFSSWISDSCMFTLTQGAWCITPKFLQNSDSSHLNLFFNFRSWLLQVFAGLDLPPIRRKAQHLGVYGMSGLTCTKSP